MAAQNDMHQWIIEYSVDRNANRDDHTEIVFLGDVALAGQVGDAIRRRGSEYLFERIPPEFVDVDILCFNLECCLSERGEVWEPKPIHLRGEPAFLSVFPRGKCQYVANVANNHFLDYGEDAAFDTLEHLHAYDVRSIGATGKAVEGPHTIVRTGAGDVGLIAFAPSAHPLPNASKVNTATECISDMISQVDALKQKSDIVIASIHQGVEYTPYVNRRCRDLAHRLVDAGADCIVCHHPHVVQGIEKYNDATIFYSIGNFIIDQDFRRRPATRRSLALKVLLHEKQLRQIIIEPFIITDALQPRPATRQERQQIRSEVELLSSAFGSKCRTRVNYLKCDCVRAYSRLSSMCEMIRQKGILATAKYYFYRIMAIARRKS